MSFLASIRQNVKTCKLQTKVGLLLTSDLIIHFNGNSICNELYFCYKKVQNNYENTKFQLQNTKTHQGNTANCDMFCTVNF